MGVSQEDFEYVKLLLREGAGIVLEEGKEYLVEARMTPVAQSAGFSELAKFFQHLRRADSVELRRRSVEALTINETSFFRDLDPFEALRFEVLPALMRQRRATCELTIWSAAAATGQEAYSVAMLLCEHFPELRDWKVTIIGTDICRKALEKARSGVYSQFEANRGLPIIYLIKYFEQNGANWHVKPLLREMVRFEELNLSKPFNLMYDIDILLIRNVLIYFDAEGKQDILTRVGKNLKPDGFLFLGTSEFLGPGMEYMLRRNYAKCSYYQRK